MSNLDLKRIESGDLVEDQQLISKTTARGIFQRWHCAADGQARLIVRSQELGFDISIDPKRVISITRKSETKHEP